MPDFTRGTRTKISKSSASIIFIKCFSFKRLYTAKMSQRFTFYFDLSEFDYNFLITTECSDKGKNYMNQYMVK